MPKWNITIENYKPATSSGSLLAYGDININKKIIICSARFFDGKNGKFVSYPSKRVPAKDGQEKDSYYPHVKIPDEDLRDEMLTAFKSEYEKQTNAPAESSGDQKSDGKVWDE